ncbi:MAG: glycosyltransferase family 2 protein [Bacteroidota bacterium]
MTKLSIIIVNYNVQHFLEQCLTSVIEATKNIESEIIVIDNNSSDGSCEMLKDKFPDVKLIDNKNNVGFAKANNQGVNIAKGEYILILNPDTVVAENTFETILNFTEKQKNPGAIGVRFIDGTGNFLPECKRNIPTFKIAIQKILGDSKNYYANHINEKEVCKVDILTGAFMLMKRDSYQEVNGFDEDFFMYGEDIDLSYKLLKKGYQNYYFGESDIIHYKGESTVKDISYLKNFYGAMHIFYKKHFKINHFYNIISKIALNSLIFLKKNGLEEKSTSENISTDNILIISNDIQILKAIKEVKKLQNIKLFEGLTEIDKKTDTVIFDNNFLNNKEILNQFQDKKLQNISKRIIPKNSNFYIGSDTAISRGEVVEFE